MAETKAGRKLLRMYGGMHEMLSHIHPEFNWEPKTFIPYTKKVRNIPMTLEEKRKRLDAIGEKLCVKQVGTPCVTFTY